MYIFVELSHTFIKLFFLDYKSSNKLISLSIQYFPDYYRSYERLALNKMYLYGEFYISPSIFFHINFKLLRNISNRILFHFNFSEIIQKRLKELKKLKKQTNYKNFLKTIEYKFVSTLYDKDKIIKFIDECSFINKEYAKINLGDGSNDHLDLEKKKNI